jgi:hypothetical protein
MNKGNMVCIHMDFYSAIKKNEIISHAGKRMEPKIMLNEISQSHKECMLSLICGI